MAGQQRKRHPLIRQATSSTGCTLSETWKDVSGLRSVESCRAEPLASTQSWQPPATVAKTTRMPHDAWEHPDPPWRGSPWSPGGIAMLPLRGLSRRAAVGQMGAAGLAALAAQGRHRRRTERDPRGEWARAPLPDEITAIIERPSTRSPAGGSTSPIGDRRGRLRPPRRRAVPRGLDDQALPRRGGARRLRPGLPLRDADLPQRRGRGRRGAGRRPDPGGQRRPDDGRPQHAGRPASPSPRSTTSMPTPSPLATLTPEDPLAGLDDLARQVAAAGIRRVAGRRPHRRAALPGDAEGRLHPDADQDQRQPDRPVRHAGRRRRAGDRGLAAADRRLPGAGRRAHRRRRRGAEPDRRRRRRRA